MKRFIATVQLVIEAKDEAEANEVVQALYEASGFYNWSYMKIGEQYLYPTEFYGQTQEEKLHDE